MHRNSRRSETPKFGNRSGHGRPGGDGGARTTSLLLRQEACPGDVRERLFHFTALAAAGNPKENKFPPGFSPGVREGPFAKRKQQRAGGMRARGTRRDRKLLTLPVCLRFPGEVPRVAYSVVLVPGPGFAEFAVEGEEGGVRGAQSGERRGGWRRNAGAFIRATVLDVDAHAGRVVPLRDVIAPSAHGSKVVVLALTS